MIEGLFSPIQLLVIGGIALLVFGPSRPPELGRGLGQAIRALETGLAELRAPRDDRSPPGDGHSMSGPPPDETGGPS